MQAEDDLSADLCIVGPVRQPLDGDWMATIDALTHRLTHSLTPTTTPHSVCLGNHLAVLQMSKKLTTARIASAALQPATPSLEKQDVRTQAQRNKMSAIRRCHMPSVLEAYEDAAWKQRVGKESWAEAHRLTNTLVRAAGSPIVPGSSRQLAPTVSSARSPFGSWKPLDRDLSPLFSSGRSSTALNLEHGFVGKPLSNSSSLPSLVAPSLSPADQQLIDMARPASLTPSLRDCFEERPDAPQPWVSQRRGKHCHKLAPIRHTQPDYGLTSFERDRYYAQFHLSVPASRGMRRPGFQMEKPYRMPPGPKLCTQFPPPLGTVTQQRDLERRLAFRRRYGYLMLVEARGF